LASVETSPDTIAVIPHATRPGIWAVVGQRAGFYSTWTASRMSLGVLPNPMDDCNGFANVWGF
jgi:hypothetical protein